MGYRVFRDSQGTEWQAWDVVPRLAERRVDERRRAQCPAPGSERRRTAERRILSGRRPILTAGMHGGWLCFEAPVEKRRLTPIPGDWQHCASDRLERYLHEAKPAARSSSAMPGASHHRDR